MTTIKYDVTYFLTGGHKVELETSCREHAERAVQGWNEWKNLPPDAQSAHNAIVGGKTWAVNFHQVIAVTTRPQSPVTTITQEEVIANLQHHWNGLRWSLLGMAVLIIVAIASILGLLTWLPL